MDLIDRYLHAVRDYLPARSQDDIVRELGDDIRAQAADREEELGRPLTRDDQAALLKPFGHPMVLAAKYRPTKQLISPVLYPYYLMALRISVSIALLVQVAIAIAMVAGGQHGGEAIGRLAAFPFNGLVTLFGWVTLVFVVIDLHVRTLAVRAAGTWDPLTLTEPIKLPGAKRPWEVALELAISTLFLFWWLGIPKMPWLIFGPASAFLALGPSFYAIQMPVAIAWLVGLAVRWTLLFRPDLERLRFAFEIASNVVSIFVAVFLLRSGDIVVLGAVGATSLPMEQITRLVQGINVAARISMIVMLLVAGWQMGSAVWKRRRA